MRPKTPLLALGLLLGGCAAGLPEPQRLLALPEDLPPGAAGADVPPGAWILHYPREAPRAVVVLVPGLGTNGLVWDLPEVGGLAGELWFEGVAVYVVLVRGAPPPTLEVWEEWLAADLREAASRHPGVPLVGIGHGLGGTALLLAATSEPGLVAGVVTLGSPLALHAPTRALSALVAAADAQPGLTWADLRTRGWQGPRGPRGFERALLSAALPERTRQAFYRHGQATMGSGLPRSLPRFVHGGPRPPLLERLARQPGLRLLVVTAPADGMWPPWMCDPATLGVRREGIRRVWVTRANGASAEYNHLDLLLHPRAGDDVLPRIVDWLDDVTSPVR